MNIRCAFAASIALGVFGCGDDSAVWPGHERPPAIVIRLDPASGPPTTAPVQYIRAPDVEFDAVIQPDFNHPTAVTAPEPGRVTRLRENGPVGLGDTLAWLERVPGPETMGPLAAGANDSGRWSAGVKLGEQVWIGDVLGMVQGGRTALALGLISDLEAEYVHAGDSAIITFGDHPPLVGRVEWVHDRSSTSGLAAEVAVEFAQELDVNGTPVASVTITPTGAEDSVLAVPLGAVVALSPGPAVFVPRPDGAYDVRWILPTRRLADLMIVPTGVDRDTRVVTHGVEALAQAAELVLKRRP